jgi:hypothetical protein
MSPTPSTPDEEELAEAERDEKVFDLMFSARIPRASPSSRELPNAFPEDLLGRLVSAWIG